MHIPLISEYKRGFIIRRVIQTFLGGPRFILVFRTSCLAIIIQATLFVLPWAAAKILNIFIDSEETNINAAMYIFGCVMGATVLTLHTVNAFVQRETKVVSKIAKPNNHLLEEDEVELSTFCGLETFKFVFQWESNWASIISFSLVSAFMCAISISYLRISTLNKWWNNQIAAASIHGFGWFTICISHYSLIATNPPEPAIFANNGSSFIGKTFRPFYTCCLLGIHCISWKYENWKEFDAYLHIVFILLPLFWMLGVLPPQDALLFWACEQILCFGFGGSATATNWWLAVMLILSMTLAFVMQYLQNWVTRSVFSACIGYLFSINIEPWVNQLFKFIFPCLHCKTFIDKVDFLEQTKLSQNSARHLLFHSGMVTMSGIVAWSPYLIDMSPQTQHIVWTASGCCTVVTLMTLLLLEQFQRAYLFKGVVKNYLYHNKSVSEFNDKRNSKFITTCWVRTAFQFMMPFVMIFIISAFGKCALHIEKSLLLPLSIVRAFHLIWRHTENSYLDMSLVYIISESTTWLSDNSIPLTVSLFIAGIVRHRMIDAWKKLYVIAVIVFTSVSNKKQRLTYSWFLLGMDIIFLPVLMVFVILSVGLSAPLLPLFTLPLFLVGFPRPVRFWPSQVGKSTGDTLDAVYYRQMMPSLISGLQKALYIGSLGM